MSITATITRLTGTLVAMMQTRLELVTVELEEEVVRLSSYFIVTLCALFFAGIALLLGIFLIIVLYWDAHRIAVLLSLITGFGSLSIGLALWLRIQFLNKPRLLEQSIAEFKKDSEIFRNNDRDPS